MSKLSQNYAMPLVLTQDIYGEANKEFRMDYIKRYERMKAMRENGVVLREVADAFSVRYSR